MKTYVEYRVRPAIKYRVTKYINKTSPDGKHTQTSESMGVFDSIPGANIAAHAFASLTPEWQGLPVQMTKDEVEIYFSGINDAADNETEYTPVKMFPPKEEETSKKHKRKSVCDDWRSKCEIVNTMPHGWEVIWKPTQPLTVIPYGEYRLSSDIRVVGWVAHVDTRPAMSTVFGTKDFAIQTLATASPPPGVL